MKYRKIPQIPYKYANVYNYGMSENSVSIISVLTIYDNPALIVQNDGQILIYNIGRAEASRTIVQDFIRNLNAKYHTNVTLLKIRRAYKENASLYVPELDFITEREVNGT